MRTFVEKCLMGKAGMEDIELYVEKWHKSESDLTLPAYLGMSNKEYALWVEKPEILQYIFFSRKHEKSIKKVIEEQNELPYAARASTSQEAEEILEWLEKTGRL